MFIVETEYLFVNLKWNQIPETEDIEHREPIQIGIVAADENLQKEKIFSKAIRLSDPTHKIKMHLSCIVQRWKI